MEILKQQIANAAFAALGQQRKQKAAKADMVTYFENFACANSQQEQAIKELIDIYSA